jgi:SagB-type dehydrogenase family enzyme
MLHLLNPIAWAFHFSTKHLQYGQSYEGNPPPSIAPNGEYSEPGQMKEYPAAQQRALPQPEQVPLAIGEAIGRRRSCRRFAERPLPLAALSALLQGAYGLGDSYLHGGKTMFDRAVPSGGGCYPLELYVLVRHVEDVPTGIHHYCARRHALEALGPAPKSDALETLFLNQPWVAKAHAVVIVTAVAPRLLHRYADRGYRYLLIEAGHVGQNLALLATASGLGSLSLGGFFDDDVSYVLGLDTAVELPLYGIALGVPETPDSAEARGLTGELSQAPSS